MVGLPQQLEAATQGWEAVGKLESMTAVEDGDVHQCGVSVNEKEKGRKNRHHRTPPPAAQFHSVP